MAFQEGAMSGATPHRTSGWAVGFSVFAGTIMIMAGFFQFFQGLAAVVQDDFFVLTRNYAFDLDVSTWGWVHMVTGGILVAAGLFIYTGNLAARMLGIALALISAVMNFFYIPYYPVWSIIIIALNIGVIWGLSNYNGVEDEI